ncbi:hypothetical protein OSTOST_22529 [Ostertagia ostertagi]
MAGKKAGTKINLDSTLRNENQRVSAKQGIFGPQADVYDQMKLKCEYCADFSERISDLSGGKRFIKIEDFEDELQT